MSDFRWNCECGARPRGPFCTKCGQPKLSGDKNRHRGGGRGDLESMMRNKHKQSAIASSGANFGEPHYLYKCDGSIRFDFVIPKCAAWYCADCADWLSDTFDPLHWPTKDVRRHMDEHGWLVQEAIAAYTSQLPDGIIPRKQFNKIIGSMVWLVEPYKSKIDLLDKLIAQEAAQVDAIHLKAEDAS